MQATPLGTARRKGLSGCASILLILAWILPILGYSVFMAAVTPRDPEMVNGLVFATFGVGIFLTIAIYALGRRDQTHIVATEGLRGTFRLYRPLVLAMVPFCILMVAVTTMLLVEDTNLTEREALVALVLYVLFGVLPVYMLVRGIHALRIDDDETLWVRGLFSGWREVRVTDYGRVRSQIMRGRYGSSFTVTGIRFDQPLHDARPFTLPLVWIRSGRYGTLVYSTLIEQFILHKLRDAAYAVQKRQGHPWKAHPTEKPKRQP